MLAGLCAFFLLTIALVCFFFFQAEDGIRDVAVTGVQTCALPIWELVAPGPDHNAERHRAIAAEDRVADVGDGNGLWPGGAEDVREPARQRRRPNHHRQREPYRRATGSHQERLPARAGYIFGGGHFDSNSVAHTVGQALAPSLIVPIAAPTEAPKFLRTAPPEVTRCLLPCVLRSSPCSLAPASPQPRRRRPSRSPPRT